MLQVHYTQSTKEYNSFFYLISQDGRDGCQKDTHILTLYIRTLYA